MNTTTDTVENLILDLLEWVTARNHTYEEVMDAWRTSCPRLPVWEDANDRGLVRLEYAGGATFVHATPLGQALLKERRPNFRATMLPDNGVILKRFEHPDEVREMTLGRFELVRLGGMTIGRATYQPGWRWSTHVGRPLGKERCEVEHVGLVVSGVATAAFADGRIIEMHAGELFYIPPAPHDSWVVGDENYVSLHFLGADHYAK